MWKGGLWPQKAAQDPGTPGGHRPSPVPHTTHRDTPRRDSFFLQRLYCLTCLTRKKKKNLQPQPSEAELTEEQATSFHTSRTFSEFFISNRCLRNFFST